jgi:antitoxin FitA
MAQALVRNLDDDIVADYKAAAKARGRSLEAELRDLIVKNRPRHRKSREELIALSKALRANTKPGPDSTDYIRWMRDTNFGKWADTDYQDPDAGH